MTRTARRHVTVVDVARHAGVSAAVVSYVVNGGPRPVAAATAERVRRAIDVLDYRPNRSAQALRTGSTGLVGLVLPAHGDPFFGPYADALHDAVAAAGSTLLTARSTGDPEAELRLTAELADRDVDGLLVATPTNRPVIARRPHPGVPTVLVNCPFPAPPFHTVGPDVVAGSRAAVEHLLGHGHRRVAMVSAATPDVDDADGAGVGTVEAGWRAALRTAGGEPSPLVRSAPTRAGGRDAVRTLLAAPEPPTAIFAGSDQQAVGALLALREAGLDVPGDVALVGFDGLEESRFSWPPLTTVESPLRGMAAAAVRAVRSEAEPGHELFAMDLVVRRSCGCP